MATPEQESELKKKYTDLDEGLFEALAGVISEAEIIFGHHHVVHQRLKEFCALINCLYLATTVTDESVILYILDMENSSIFTFSYPIEVSDPETTLFRVMATSNYIDRHAMSPSTN